VNNSERDDRIVVRDDRIVNSSEMEERLLWLTTER